MTRGRSEGLRGVPEQRGEEQMGGKVFMEERRSCRERNLAEILTCLQSGGGDEQEEADWRSRVTGSWRSS